jgi:hypothetical protein
MSPLPIVKVLDLGYTGGMKTLWGVIGVSVCVMASACGAQSGDAFEESVDSTEQELNPSTPTSFDSFAGVLRVGTGTGTNFVSHCTAILWNNNTALTATSCVIPSATVRMGTQSASVTKSLNVPGVEISMIRLSSALQVWNPTKTSHPSTGYNHPVFSSSSSTLHGQLANVVVRHPQAREGSRTIFVQNDDLVAGNLDISGIQPEDKGGGVISFTNNNPAWSTIYGIARCSAGDVVCAAEGADRWYVPLALNLLAGW